MPLAVRKLDHKPYWDRSIDPIEPWLRAGDLAADALKDLQTDKNRLSVYIVESLQSPLLGRVLAALAARRDFLTKLDYAALDLRLLEDLEIETEQTLGDTSDVEVNRLHQDLIHLTAPKLANLGLAIRNRATVARCQPAEVCALIQSGIANGQIDQTKLKPELRARLA